MDRSMWEVRLEQVRKQVPSAHNAYRPSERPFEDPASWTPKWPLPYGSNKAEMSKSVRAARDNCSRPQKRQFETGTFTSCLNLDYGFGPYLSETREQFKRTGPPLMGDPCVYELPSGFSTSLPRNRIWSQDEEVCNNTCHNRNRRDTIVTPPQRYNPWPRYLVGQNSFLNPQYRPNDCSDYKCVTVAGTKDFDAHDFIY